MSTVDTLFSALETASHQFDGARICFINAKYSAGYALDFSAMDLFQYFKADVDRLVAQGLGAHADYSKIKEKSYDYALVLLPQNMIAARAHIALGLRALKQGGKIYVAADNKAGGTRIAKMLQGFGLDDVVSESRNKARCCTATLESLNDNEVEKALEDSRVQEISDGAFCSVPGIFGWDKIDKGSEILTRVLPLKELKGKGADLGCGYGYLSDFVLNNCPKVKEIHAIDADARAIDVCAVNLKKYEQQKHFHWHDMTQPLKALHNLDFVIMNPPFHEGKKQDVGIGKDFIQNAYASLHKFGRLWMVANAHLPYENLLHDIFFKVEKHHEGQGFKVFEATK